MGNRVSGACNAWIRVSRGARRVPNTQYARDPVLLSGKLRLYIRDCVCSAVVAVVSRPLMVSLFPHYVSAVLSTCRKILQPRYPYRIVRYPSTLCYSDRLRHPKSVDSVFLTVRRPIFFSGGRFVLFHRRIVNAFFFLLQQYTDSKQDIFVDLYIYKRAQTENVKTIYRVLIFLKSHDVSLLYQILEKSYAYYIRVSFDWQRWVV